MQKKTVKNKRRTTRRNYGTEEKLRTVLEGLRVEHSIAKLCRIEDINYFWPTNPAAAFKAFAEYNIVRGIKIAIKAGNLAGKRSTSLFTFYNDHIKFNDVLSRTERETTNWTEITLSVKGTF